MVHAPGVKRDAYESSVVIACGFSSDFTYFS
jgi:hypothetical protein